MRFILPFPSPSLCQRHGRAVAPSHRNRLTILDVLRPDTVLETNVPRCSTVTVVLRYSVVTGVAPRRNTY